MHLSAEDSSEGTRSPPGCHLAQMALICSPSIPSVFSVVYKYEKYTKYLYIFLWTQNIIINNERKRIKYYYSC